MDDVTPKSVIKIGENSSIVLGYLRSCRRERSRRRHRDCRTEVSKAHLADVQAEKTNYAANRRSATTRQTSGVAATVLRSVHQSKTVPCRNHSSRYMAHRRSWRQGRGKLTLQRLDVPGERQEISLGGTQLKGRFFDFASENVALAPGGLYAATFKSSHIVFRVDPQAQPVRRRSSAGCSEWNRRVGPAILRIRRRRATGL